MNTTGILGPGSAVLTAEVKQIQVLKNILCESDEIFGTETFFFLGSEILVKKMLNRLDSKYVNSWKIKCYLCPDIFQHTMGTMFALAIKNNQRSTTNLHLRQHKQKLDKMS